MFRLLYYYTTDAGYRLLIYSLVGILEIVILRMEQLDQNKGELLYIPLQVCISTLSADFEINNDLYEA